VHRSKEAFKKDIFEQMKNYGQIIVWKKDLDLWPQCLSEIDFHGSGFELIEPKARTKNQIYIAERKINMKKVVIMRGQSGAGKSTYAKKNFPGAVMCSADSFFIDPKTGEYKFDPTKLGFVHNSCQRKYEAALKSGEPLVVVDNTNTTLKEMQPYLQLADVYGYDVEVIRLDTPVGVAAKRNTHGVPAVAVQKMRDRMIDFPGETVVSGMG
jgi:predicted kinase